MRIKMFCNDPPSLYPNTFICSCYMNSSCNIDENRNSYLRIQEQSTINEINRNMLSMFQSNLYSRTANTIAVPYYGLNKECVNVYGKPKKKLTIYDLDQLIFPFDPIRDWVEKKTKEINKKYAWAEELSGRRALEGRKVYE